MRLLPAGIFTPPNWVYVAVAIVLMVYVQLVVKWQSAQLGTLPDDGGQRLLTVAQLLLNPWIISGFAATLVAALSWFVAMTVYDLSFAYPFMGITFVAVLLLSALLLGEPLTAGKVIATGFVVAGLAIGARL
jgi:multidrug transporter EmrE-like cation transporter